MLFDEYRKILNFKVSAFEFDELDNGVMKLAEFISCVRAINESEINYLSNGSVWDKVINSYNSAVKARNNLQRFKELTAPQDIESKFRNCGSKIEAEKVKRAQEINRQSGRVKELLAKFKSGDNSNASLNFDYVGAFAKISNAMNAYIGANDILSEEYNNYKRVCAEWNSAYGRIQDVKEKIGELLEVKLTLDNYKRYRNDFEIAQAAYSNLDADERKLIGEYKKFHEKYMQLAALAKKENELEKARLKKKKKASIVKDWAASVWIVAIFAGLCVGIYFLTKASWFFKAPDWCFNHKINLWSWHNWGSGTAFGVVNAMMTSGLAGFWKVVFWLPCAAIDLIVYVLQGIWWLLAAISWPVRWLLSRAAGLLLYALAYGLTGLLAIAACVFIGLEDFTLKKYWGCRIINMILCLGLAALEYVLIFVF